MLATLLLLTALPAPQQFEAAVQLNDPASADELVVGDFDGDGFDDLIAIDRTSTLTLSERRLALFLADGAGGFERSRLLDVDSAGDDLAATDFDGDGDLDLVDIVGNARGFANQIRVRVNDGSASFSPPSLLQPIPGLAKDPFGATLDLVDLDGDGDDDFVFEVVPLLGPTSTFVSISVGGGVLAAPTLLLPPGVIAGSFTLSDLDGDGDADGLGTDGFEILTVWRNDGTLPLTTQFPAGPGSNALDISTTADVDGDGDLDLVARFADVVPNTIEWRENVGNLQFAPPILIDTLGTSATNVLVDDLDADGDVDVGVVDGDTTQPKWSENVGGGSFAAPQPLPSQPWFIGFLLAVANIDGDGRNDLVRAGTSGLAVARTLPAGSQDVWSPLVEVSTPRVRQNVVATDADGDGFPDLVGLNAGVIFPGSPNALFLARGNESNALSPIRTQTLLTGQAAASVEVAADLDGDGDDDLAARTANGLTTIENVGGAFQSVTGTLSGDPVPTLAAGDLDDDGDDDLVFVDEASGRIEWLESTGLTLPPTTRVVGQAIAVPPGGFASGRFAIGDVDGDGVTDVCTSVLASSGDGRVLYFRGLGGGVFAQPVEVWAGPVDRSIQLVDIDADQRPDLFFGTRITDSTTQLRVSVNSSTGFGGALLIGPVIPTSGPDWRLADVNLDGSLQLVLALQSSPAGGVVAVSTLGFSATLEFIDTFPSFELSRGSLILEDFDDDGDLDIAVTVDGNPTLYRNRTLSFGSIGTIECANLPNTTGRVGTISALGSAVLALDSLELRSTDLPANAAGYYLASLTPALIPNPGGSAGLLCVGGAIGRFIGPGQVLFSGPAGEYALDVDVNSIPQPTGFVAIVPGQTWRFQSWYRDGATSNFTDSIRVTFE
ncbi:MAG: VCBS repeat-containing protein [Planctomycetota bacterium]